MKKLNIILVYNKKANQILMCKREKEPYKGKYNLVGGKLEENEDSLSGAYRELEEETGITSEDINIYYLMNFQYIIDNTELQIFVGRLNKELELKEEVNKLYWLDVATNFFEEKIFAGEGNIGHIFLYAEKHKEK